MTVIFSQEEIDEGMRRIGALPEGRFLTQLLLVELQAVAPFQSEGCALSELNGRRRFAAELLRALAPLSTASHRTDHNASTAVELARSSGGRRSVPAGPGGIKRRVPDDPE